MLTKPWYMKLNLKLFKSMKNHLVDQHLKTPKNYQITFDKISRNNTPHGVGNIVVIDVKYFLILHMSMIRMKYEPNRKPQ